MSVETVDTLVVGAGQAGVAMSEHLSTCGYLTSCLSGTALRNVGVRKDGTPWLLTVPPGMIAFRGWNSPTLMLTLLFIRRKLRTTLSPMRVRFPLPSAVAWK